MRALESASLTASGVLRHPLGAGLVSGALLGTAYLCVPYAGPVLAWVALLPLLRLWRDEYRLRARVGASVIAMALAQALALGYFLPQAPVLMGVVVTVQAAAASLPWLLLAGLSRLARLGSVEALWFLPGLWLSNEWVMSFFPDIVPTPLGGTLGGLPEAIWFYSVTGVWGGTLLLLVFQVAWTTSRLCWRSHLGFALAFGGVLLGLGVWLPRLESERPVGTEIALLRTGIRPPEVGMVPWLDRALILSARAVRDGAGLIAWPESAIPWEVADNASHPLHQAVVAQPGRYGVPFLLGLNRLADSTSLYNGAVLLRPGESLAEAQVRHKYRLLPLREKKYFFGLGRDWVRPGETGRSLAFVGRSGQRHVLGSLICYEVLVSAIAADQVRSGAQALIVLANDAEFHHTPAQWQLEAQARVRAVETRRDVLRVASLGALQHFDAWGRKRTHQEGEAGYVLVSPTWREGSSLYARQPHWLPMLVGSAVLMGSLLALIGRLAPLRRILRLR